MVNKKKKIKSMTLDDSKKEVLKLVQQGVNFREIAKKKFLIGDRIKKFSIGEISKIKKEASEVKDISKNTDEDTALLFKKFSEGRRPLDLIIETKLNPDFVKDAYTKFTELEDMRIVPAKFFYSVRESIERLKEDDYIDYDEDHKCLKETVDYFIDPENF